MRCVRTRRAGWGSVLVALGTWLLAGCGDDGGSGDGGAGSASGTGGPSTGASSAPGSGGGGSDTSSTSSASSTTTGSSTTSSSSTGGGPVSSSCAPLDPPAGEILDVTPADDVSAIVAGAPPGSTVRFAAGTYDLAARTLAVRAAGVTLRSATDQASDVVLDGGYQTPAGGVVAIYDQSDVTVAHLTIRRPRFHAVHVTATAAPADRVRLHGLRIEDPGEQAIKVNHGGEGFFADDGELACSSIELTDVGRIQVMGYESSGSRCYTGGIDAHGTRGWVVRDNVIRGFWCSNDDLSEHGIHFWRGARGTTVERNVLIDNARGIGFGLSDPSGRAFDDGPCGGVASASHYEGRIANNFIAATRPELFASPSGVDGGIALAHACDASVVHNTVATTETPFASIEWRFEGTNVELVNNLATHPFRPRDGATAAQLGNVEDAPLGDFVDVAAGDLHLVAGASAIDAGDPAGSAVAPQDVDGDLRGGSPDVGADER